MKKITISLLLLICLMCCSGCEYESENIESRAERGFIEYVDFSYDVVADEDTHILYIYHNPPSGNNDVLCPYYSKNGKLCRYEDGKIIEVENAE